MTETQELVPAERALAKLFTVWFYLFGVGAICFLLWGRELFMSANYLSSQVFYLEAPLTPVPDQFFWNSLTVSLMSVLTYLSWLIKSDVRRWLDLVPVVLVSKLVSTLLFLGCYWLDQPYFLYFIGAVFSDGPIFLITLIFYRRARTSGRL